MLAGCEDDEAVVEWLVREHGVCVIPGSACGAAGYIRAAYANLQPEACREAGAAPEAGPAAARGRGHGCLGSCAADWGSEVVGP